MSRILKTIFCIFLLGAAGAPAAEVRYLEQNWSQADREWFYHASQGSELLPYRIFAHLETADGKQLFRSDEHIRHLGFIPSPPTRYNPDGLPVGFTRSREHVGPTCAACHTQQIEYQGVTVQIDGGQTFGDLQLLLVELERALRATLDDEARLARLVDAVFDGHASPAQAAGLAEELEAAWQQRRLELDQAATSSRYGYARLDAFGNILNRSLLLAGGEGNRIEPNAPVSYPYLWDTPQHDYVEWNGSSPNPKEGALARNVGEVIGVFGSVDVTHKHRRLGFLDGGYQSSVKTRNLRRIEQHVAKLLSPQWPAFFPPVDPALASQGRALYEQHCIACHEDFDRAAPDRMVRVQMASLDAIGTDPMMARNAVMLQGKSGRFEGEPRFYLAGEAMGAEVPALFIANHIMGGVLKNNFLDIVFAQREAARMGHTVRHPPKLLDGAPMPEGEEVSDRALLAYKARPLNGVWTSAPYLHNGSVANMYQLMLPAEERYESFHVGSLEFDAAVLGFSTRASADTFLFDTSLPGNSNAGHEYGTGAYGQPRLSHDEILAVVEYVKTL